MKRKILIFTTLLILLVAVVWACQENDAETKIGTTSSSGEKSSAKSDGKSGARTSSPFTRDVGKPIPKETAEQWIANYKKNNADGLDSHFFGRDAFEKLLAQKDAVGISIHYALNNDGPQLLLVGVTENGSRLTGDGDEGYTDMSSPCPPCDPPPTEN